MPRNELHAAAHDGRLADLPGTLSGVRLLVATVEPMMA